MHKMQRIEKRAHMTGTMVTDFPSGCGGAFNIHTGMSDGDACSETDFYLGQNNS